MPHRTITCTKDVAKTCNLNSQACPQFNVLLVTINSAVTDRHAAPQKHRLSALKFKITIFCSLQFKNTHVKEKSWEGGWGSGLEGFEWQTLRRQSVDSPPLTRPPLPPSAVQQVTTANPSLQSRYTPEINGPSSTAPFTGTASARGITYQSRDHTPSNLRRCEMVSRQNVTTGLLPDKYPTWVI
jgi:hypothetical protein